MISNEKIQILSLILQMFVHATNENDHKNKCSFLQFYLNINLSHYFEVTHNMIS